MSSRLTRAAFRAHRAMLQSAILYKGYAGEDRFASVAADVSAAMRGKKLVASNRDRKHDASFRWKHDAFRKAQGSASNVYTHPEVRKQYAEAVTLLVSAGQFNLRGFREESESAAEQARRMRAERKLRHRIEQRKSATGSTVKKRKG